MTNLTVFAFEAQQVRFVGTAEQPEWVAQDICECLELSDTSKALEPLEADEKGTKIVRTLGGEQEMLTVMEPGLYRLVFKSRKPIAQRFKRWVFHEVIPSVRKTGSYSIKPSAPTAKLSSPKERLETIQLGIDLFQRLGGCDERTELLLEEKLQPALPGRVELPVSDRALVLGYRPTSTQLCQIGKQAARIYQQRHGQKPVQREQFVAGTTRMVNVYSEADVDILDQAITLVMTT